MSCPARRPYIIDNTLSKTLRRSFASALWTACETESFEDRVTGPRPPSPFNRSLQASVPEPLRSVKDKSFRSKTFFELGPGRTKSPQNPRWTGARERRTTGVEARPVRPSYPWFRRPPRRLDPLRRGRRQPPRPPRTPAHSRPRRRPPRAAHPPPWIWPASSWRLWSWSWP